MRRWTLALAVSFSIVAVSGAAHAGNEAAAEALFAEAKKLVAKGRYAEACPKFAESNKLDRGAGTLIHLADCYEKNKQTATAWATYKEAASAAQALNRADWQKRATSHAAALEPKLAHLVVKVPFPVDKIDVTNDGGGLSNASWDVPLPVDVGTHEIEAKAPGHKPFKTSARVAKDGETIEVVIPKLDEEPKADGVATKPEPAVAPVADSSSATTESRGSSQRTIGFILTGVGVAGLAVGAVTGLMAVGKNNDSKALCPEDGACGSREALDANDSAKSLGTISTVGFIAGGALVAGGLVLLFTAPKDRVAGNIHVTPHAGLGGGGLFLQGAF